MSYDDYEGGLPFWVKEGFSNLSEMAQHIFARLPVVQWMDQFIGVEGDRLFFAFWDTHIDNIIKADDAIEFEEFLKKEAKIYFGDIPNEAD